MLGRIIEDIVGAFLIVNIAVGGVVGICAAKGNSIGSDWSKTKISVSDDSNLGEFCSGQLKNSLIRDTNGNICWSQLIAAPGRVTGNIIGAIVNHNSRVN